MRRRVRVLLVCLLWPAVVSAQTPAELIARLAGETGVARARTLAALTDALRQDKPAEAIVYGEQALALLSENPDPEAEVRTLNEMAWAHMTLSQYDRAISFAQRGRVKAEEYGDARGRARAINNLGVIAQRRGEAITAVEHFTEALKAYREIGSELEISTSLNNLGFVYSTALADYETGLTYHVEALALREKLGDRASMALSLNNIGIIYHRIGELDRARDYFERSLAIRRELGGDNAVAGTLSNIGDVYYERKDDPKALAHHSEALELRRRIGDQAGIAASLRAIALINTRQGHLREARRQLDESLKMAQAAGERTIGAQAHLAIAAFERVHGSPAAAVIHARRALTISEQAGALELTRQGWEELAAAQELAGDYPGALASLRRFQEVNARIFDADRTRRVELLERRYQSERKESEIAQLRAQQATAELTLDRQQNQRNAALVVAAVFGIVGYTMYRRRVESGRLAQRLSVTDALTGLKNRRYVLQTIKADLAASERRLAGRTPGEDGDLVFYLIDIDHFKAINDKLGHEAGDKVLVQLGAALAKACRAADTVARWGGEEFLVIGRFTSRHTAAVNAERIRRTFESCVIDVGAGRTVRCTCSVGYASYPFLPSDVRALSWEQVVALADDGLYLAKQRGRNRWVGVVAGSQAAPPRLDRSVADGVETWLNSGAVRLETPIDRPTLVAERIAPAV
jgi:diguanylate cyclase (GGDEF)-like protein